MASLSIGERTLVDKLILYIFANLRRHDYQ